MRLTYFFNIFVGSAFIVDVVWAGFESSSKQNTVVYWGQNSASNQQRLSHYCSNSKISVIALSFLTNIANPKLNFANMGDRCTMIGNSKLFSCPEIAADIDECQTVYGKTILLSVGGATTDERGFTDSASAEKAAKTIWGNFGPKTAANEELRPFDSTSIDGFDFDFEHAIPNLTPFASELRKLMDASSPKTSKKYLLTAAPQCYWPDAANGPMLDGKVYFDAIFVQFYNNGCGLQNFTYGSESQHAFNFERWDKWAKTTSKNSAVKILLGVPAAQTAAGSGFKDGSDLDQIITYSQKFDSFGGIMMWDVDQAYSNPGFIDRVSLSLGGVPSSGVVPLANNTVPSRPTTKSSSLSTILTTPTTTISLRPSPKPTPAIHGSLRTLPYTNSSVPAAAQPVTSSEEGDASSEPTSTPENTDVNTPPSQSDVVKPLVNHWNQCGGKDWNGGTQCKDDAKCKFLGEWYLHCVPDNGW